MKSARATVCLLCLLVALAGAKLPTGTYGINELDEARVEALKRGRAVAFLVSEPESKYSKTQEATTLAIKELRSYAVVVFLVSKKVGELVMPPPVVTGLRGPIGMFDPRIVLKSADLTETFETIGNEKLVGGAARDTYSELTKLMGKRLDGWESSGNPPAEELTWMRGNERHYRGRYLELKDGELTVETVAGKSYSFPLQRLGKKSQARAQQLFDAGD